MRCFHVDTRLLNALGTDWAMTIRAESGSKYVEYGGWVEPGLKRLAAEIGASAATYLKNKRGVEFFHPWTTTLVEVVLDRRRVASEERPLVEFPDQAERIAAREADRAARQAAERAEAEARDQARIEELMDGFVRQRGES